MKLSILTHVGLLASVSKAMYQCPITTPGEPNALEFAFSVQKLLYDYYESVPVNTTFFDTLPMGTKMSPLNNMTMSANVVTNLEGLQKQSMIAGKGILELGAMYPDFQEPACEYTLPTAMNASSHIMNAFLIEASLCGAFIGLADYVQTPTEAFLMARIAAEHGIHAAYILSYMNAAPFSAQSTMLTPAFTPTQILRQGSEVGMLGGYLGGCVAAPAAPCGATVQIGDANAELVAAGAGSGSGTTGSNVTTTGSSTPVQVTGNAASRNTGFGAVLSGAVAFAAMLL